MKKNPLFKAPVSKQIRLRTIAISVLLTLIFGLAATRAFQLHLGDHSKLQRLAKRQYQKLIVLAPKRGNILDRHGETLALDLQVDSVYATPHRIDNPKALAKKLAKLLELPYEKVLQQVSKSEKKFVWIKRRLEPAESEKFKNAKLEGVGILPEYKRFYPNGNLAANLLGAVGMDATALAGLELSYDTVIKSEDPPFLIEQDARGRAYNPYALVGLEHPKQIVLTIDKTIQYITEQALLETMEKSQAVGGMAIVLQVKTGEILAMASSPTFDPNHYSDFPFKNWRNRTVTDAFEPGSTFKAITAALALEHHVFDTKQKLHCENGEIRIGKHIIHDHHRYGLLDLGEILKYSSNICSLKLAHKVGKDKFIEGLQKFGFGKKTPLQAPGEQSGFLVSAKHLSKIQLGTIGFGQGISATPLQITMAYGALANEGQLMKPLMVKEVRDSKGNTLKRFSPQILKQAVSAENAKTVLTLLKKVVEKGGTGTQADLSDYTVAGKTGTAQKVIEGRKGYAKNKYLASFVGVAPVENPELVILVSIDEPKGSYYGGTVSAPAFNKIAGQSLTYLNVSPSPEKNPATTQLAKGSAELHNWQPLIHPSSHQSTSPKVIANTQNSLKSLTKVSAKTDSTINKSAKQNKPKNSLDQPRVVPDFTGLSVREVLREAHHHSLQVKIKGSGICISQEPAAGEEANTNLIISLHCQAPSG